MSKPENAFLATLAELQGGSTLAELHRAMSELVGQVRSVGKPGSLTISIKVSPKANGNQLLITDEVKIAPPKPDREITIMFADDENRLSRRDPRQPRLPDLDKKADVVQHRRPFAVNEGTGEITE